MTILGIETSTAVCSVGFARQNSTGTGRQPDGIDLQSEKSIVESHIHSEKLLTLIQELCDEQTIPLSQVDGVAVSIGPGSFTGLRIGLSTAKGLCAALGKPLVAVPTFEAIVRSVVLTHPECEEIIVCIDAKQREYYIGSYENRTGTVHEVRAVHTGSLSSALAAVSAKTVIVTDRPGEVTMESRDSILVENVLPFCRGDVIAGMAGLRIRSGLDTEWKELEPMYLKDFTVKVRANK